MRRARIVAIAVGLTALAGSGVGSAAAQGSDEPDGLAADVRAVAAVAPLRTDNGTRARQVYEALIPDGLSMPRSAPAVGFWLSELSSVRSNGSRPTDDASHWLEGAVQIRVRHGDVEGWYPIHYPVTAEFWFHAGRAVGLPKRRADAAIVADGGGWTASATPRGTTGGPSMTLAWKPAGGEHDAAAQRAYRIPTEPLLVLNSALRGPDLMHVQYVLNKPYPFQTVIPGGAPAYSDSATAQVGLVNLSVRPMLDALQEPDLPKIFPAGTDLGDVIVPQQTVPGSHAFYALTIGSESKTIGQGGYRSMRSIGGDGDSGRRGRAACVRRRTVTLRVRTIPGARVRRVRAYVNGKRVRSRFLGTKRVGRTQRARRVRVSLRRVKAQRVRVTVVVRQSRGFRTKTTRRYRRCKRR